MGYVYYLCSMKVRAIQLLRKIINIMKKLTQEQEQETNAIIAGIKAAFSETYKGAYQYKIINDSNISIDEVLELKGFKKRIEEKNRRTWVVWEREDLGIDVSYNAEIKEVFTINNLEN